MPSASGETQDTETGGGKGITERNYSLPVLAVLSLVMSVWVSCFSRFGERDTVSELQLMLILMLILKLMRAGDKKERERTRHQQKEREREREGEREKTWGNERETGNDREESSFKTDASIQVCSSRCIFPLFLVLRTWGDHRLSLFVRNVVNKSVSVTPGNDTLLWILSWEGFDAGELFPDEEK